MGKRTSILKFVNDLAKTSKNEESFNTGLVGEALIISGYKSMPLEKLEKLRFILNKIIKRKIEMKRVKENLEREKNV